MLCAFSFLGPSVVWNSLPFSVRRAQTFVFLQVTAQDSAFLCLVLLTFATVSGATKLNVCVCVCVCVRACVRAPPPPSLRPRLSVSVGRSVGLSVCLCLSVCLSLCLCLCLSLSLSLSVPYPIMYFHLFISVCLLSLWIMTDAS